MTKKLQAVATAPPRRRWRRIVLVTAGVLAAALLAALSLPAGLVLIPYTITVFKERGLRSTGRMTEVARTLALYCNSTDRPLESPAIGIGWLPPELRALDPSFVALKPDGGSFAFGGGFHHAEYGLWRRPDGQWTLSFSSEGAWTAPAEVTITSEARLDRGAFVDTMKANYRSYVDAYASSDTPLEAHEGRIRFLLELGSLDDVRSAARELAARHPDHGGAQYIAALVERALGDEAAATTAFVAWDTLHPGFRHETFLVSYLASGPHADRAVAVAERALHAPLVDAPGTVDAEWNYSALGTTLVTALVPIDADLAIKLCDKVETEETEAYSADRFRPALEALRRRALARKAGTPEPALDLTDALATPLDFEAEFLGRSTWKAIARRRGEAPRR